MIFTRRNLLLCAILGIALVLSLGRATSGDISLSATTDADALYAALEKTIPQLMDSARVQGLAIAVIREGEIAWHRGFGTKNGDTKEPMTKETVFQAASLSKPVFAYAVLQIIEEGNLELDKPLIEYVPESYIEESFLQRAIEDERFRKITARMVLSHCSGFPNWRNDDSGLTIDFDPGEKFSYSGEGFVYLQKVVEHITGKSISEIARERIFEPLQMSSSSYVWREEYEDRLANGHFMFGGVQDLRRMKTGNAAYSLYTTAGDFGKFVAAILNGTGLRTETLAQMLEPQIQMPRKWGDDSSLADGLHWGLGWGLQLTEDGTGFWHWGDNGTFRCYVIANRDQKNGVVYFTNSANGLSVASRIARLAVGGQHPPFDWLNYDRYDSSIYVFVGTALKSGIDSAIEQFHRHREGGGHELEEGMLNRLGYHFLGQNKYDDAIKLFRLNIELFPESWNVYDSFAEANLRKGDWRVAAEYYQKSLDINPDNGNAKRLLSQLRVDGLPSGNAEFRLKDHAEAGLVTVAGSFNQWNPLHTLLYKRKDGWVRRLELAPGKHLYKFVVDGEWMTDPSNPKVEEDDNGNLNSVLIVE